MSVVIGGRLNIKNNKTNIDKYIVAVNITEYYITSILIFLRITIPKFMKIRQLFQLTCLKGRTNFRSKL